jgi:hypothetical protein
LKRLAPCFAAVAALALAAPIAGAAEKTQHRGALPQAAVEFQAVSVNGDIVKVNKFKFFDVALACDEGGLFVSRNKPLPAMKVNKRNRFRETFDFQGAEEVKVAGKITNGGTQARGSLRVSGNFTVDGVRYNNCDSGKVKWST